MRNQSNLFRKSCKSHNHYLNNPMFVSAIKEGLIDTLTIDQLSIKKDGNKLSERKTKKFYCIFKTINFGLMYGLTGSNGFQPNQSERNSNQDDIIDSFKYLYPTLLKMPPAVVRVVC